MPIIVRSLDELNSVSQAQFITTGYTDAQYKGTGIRTIVEATNLSLSQFYIDAQNGLQGQFISRATAEVLDALGLLVGCIRYSGESDNNFRVRILNALSTAATANIVALTQALLGLSEVRDVIVKKYANGIGSIAFYLIGISGIVDANTVALAQSTVDNIAAAGAFNMILTPTQVNLNVSASITTSSQAATIDVTTLQNGAITAAAKYVASLNMGSPFIVAELTTAVLNTSTSITNFQLTGLSITDSSGNTNELLPKDYQPLYDQELVPARIQII